MKTIYKNECMISVMTSESDVCFEVELTIEQYDYFKEVFGEVNKRSEESGTPYIYFQMSQDIMRRKSDEKHRCPVCGAIRYFALDEVGKYAKCSRCGDAVYFISKKEFERHKEFIKRELAKKIAEFLTKYPGGGALHPVFIQGKYDEGILEDCMRAAKNREYCALEDLPMVRRIVYGFMMISDSEKKLCIEKAIDIMAEQIVGEDEAEEEMIMPEDVLPMLKSELKERGENNENNGD